MTTIAPTATQIIDQKTGYITTKEREVRRLQAKRQASELVVKHESVKIDNELLDNLIIPLMMISPYYFDSYATSLLEISFEENLTQTAARMQQAAERRVRYLTRDLKKRLARWRLWKETGKFYHLDSVNEDGTLVA